MSKLYMLKAMMMLMIMIATVIYLNKMQRFIRFVREQVIYIYILSDVVYYFQNEKTIPAKRKKRRARKKKKIRRCTT